MNREAGVMRRARLASTRARIRVRVNDVVSSMRSRVIDLHEVSVEPAGLFDRRWHRRAAVRNSLCARYDDPMARRARSQLKIVGVVVTMASVWWFALRPRRRRRK